MRLLVTRQQPGAQRTAAALRARGHEPLLAPLLRIEAAAAELPAGPWAAIAITSANAVHALAGDARLEALSAVRVYAVGRRSAEATRSAGFADVISADGDANDLARLLRDHCAAGARVLYLAGEKRSGDLAAALTGVEVHTVAVYRALAAAGLPGAVRAALASGSLDGVLHYSRRSADTYIDAARAAGLVDVALTLTHYCLSAQVAAPLAAAGATDVRIAAEPEEPSLLALIDTP